MKALLKTLSVVSLLVVGITGAQAADTTWDFKESNGQVSKSSDNYGNTLSSTSNGYELDITAWSAYNNENVYAARADLNDWGLLAYNSSNDQHYIDNNGRTDMLLFSFDAAVGLTSLKMGATSHDSDISIAAFSSMPTLAGNSWETIASNAIFKTSYANIGTSSLSLSGIATEAKYWLIGAYNKFFGGNQNWENSADKLKLLTLVTRDVPEVDVPAPATALLMLLGLGLVGLRRRQK